MNEWYRQSGETGLCEWMVSPEGKIGLCERTLSPEGETGLCEWTISPEWETAAGRRYLEQQDETCLKNGKKGVAS